MGPNTADCSTRTAGTTTTIADSAIAASASKLSTSSQIIWTSYGKARPDLA